MVSMSIEREFFFTYAAVKNLNYNFSALKDLTISLNIHNKNVIEVKGNCNGLENR